MAGSWNHITEDETGKLLSNVDAVGMLENGGDWYEFAEEVYGMVWKLAERLETLVGGSKDQWVKLAQEHFQEGLALSPGIAARAQTRN